MDIVNSDKFFREYRTQLEQAVILHPDEYSFPVELCDKVWFRMRDAVLRGSFNKDGYAFKTTCKNLGIKYTYKAINEYLDL